MALWARYERESVNLQSPFRYRWIIPNNHVWHLGNPLIGLAILMMCVDKASIS